MKAGLLMYFTLFLVFAGITMLLYLLLRPSVFIPEKDNPNEITVSVSPIQVTESAKPRVTEKPKPLEYAAWIPSWGSVSALTSLKSTGTKIKYSTISPVWYDLNSDGSLKDRYPANRNELESWLRAQNIAIIPAVACFDHEILTKVLQNPENFDRQIETILKKVVDNNYAGIDLDYESTKLSDKEKYFEFLNILAAKLHENNKRLIVTVVAKWGDDIAYPSLIETRQVQDWSRISDYADEIRIMAYDYTYISSKLPGPIAPSGWLNDVLDYALEYVPQDKLVLGIALYAYEWSAPDTEPEFNYTANFMENSAGSKSAAAYQYKEVLDIIKRHPDGKMTSFEDESILTYIANDKRYLLNYFTPENIKTRVQLAKDNAIKGVVFWRIGNEANQLELL